MWPAAAVLRGSGVQKFIDASGLSRYLWFPAKLVSKARLRVPRAGFRNENWQGNTAAMEMRSACPAAFVVMGSKACRWPDASSQAGI
jgi:hypothetical protein